MRLTLKAAFAALTLAVFSTAASAGTLNISFAGTIDRTNDGGNASVLSIGPLAVGDAVTGSFMLDTMAAATSTTATTASYGNAVTGFTMTLDGLTYSSNTANAFQVRDNDMSGTSAPLRDSVLLSAFDVSGPSILGLTPARIQFALGGTDTSILSDLGIPTSALLQSLFAADNIGGNLNFLSLSDGSEARFAIDTLDISAVPLPASIPLLLSGFGLFAAMRRRQVKRS